MIIYDLNSFCCSWLKKSLIFGFLLFVPYIIYSCNCKYFLFFFFALHVSIVLNANPKLHIQAQRFFISNRGGICCRRISFVNFILLVKFHYTFNTVYMCSEKGLFTKKKINKRGVTPPPPFEETSPFYACINYSDKIRFILQLNVNTIC